MGFIGMLACIAHGLVGLQHTKLFAFISITVLDTMTSIFHVRHRCRCRLSLQYLQYRAMLTRATERSHYALDSSITGSSLGKQRALT